MASSKKDPAADATAAATEAAQAQVRAEQASQAALEQSAIDLQTKSLDHQFSTTRENPDPNPLGLRPAPGPSMIQELGEPHED